MEYRYTWHFVHLFLTLCFLPWLLVWVLRHVVNSAHNDRVDIWRALQK
jgi:hypothetical protein